MQLYSRLEGEGPVLVFNHGWTMSHRFFERQASLREHFRILLWDLPGHGDSEKREGGYALADCSQALRELFAAYGIEAAYGVGWSMGAQVLWDYVGRFGAEPFRGFVNVDALAWGDPDYYQVTAVNFAFQRNRPRAARKFIKNMFVHPPDEATLQWMVEDSLRTPTPIALKYYAEIAACDYREVFRKLDKPLWSLMGTKGPRNDGVAELQVLHPRQELVEFERSGHLPFWEEAERFNRWLIEKLAPP